MKNINKTVYAKVFIHDLIAAHLLPKRECKNPLVKSFIKEFPQKRSIKFFINSAKITCRKLPSSFLYQIIQEAENLVDPVLDLFDYKIWATNSWSIEDKEIRCMVRSIGPVGAEWLCRWIQVFICSLHEFLRRIDSELDGLHLTKKSNKFKTDSILTALFQLERIKSPLLKRIVSDMEEELDIKLEEQLLTREEVKLGIKRDHGLLSELNNDIALVGRTIEGIDEADCDRVGDIFYEILFKDCDKQYTNLSEVEIIESVGKKDKKKEKGWTYLPNRVLQAARDELTDYPRLRQRELRLRKKGGSKEEIEEMMKKESKPFSKFKNPVGLYRKKKKDGQIIVKEYISGSYDQLEIISYVETEEMIIKTLEDCKQTVFKNHPKGQVLIDYLLKNLDNEEAKFTNREISDKTGIHEDVIGRMRKLLEKEVPIIRELLQ